MHASVYNACINIKQYKHLSGHAVFSKLASWSKGSENLFMYNSHYYEHELSGEMRNNLILCGWYLFQCTDIN